VVTRRDTQVSVGMRQCRSGGRVQCLDHALFDHGLTDARRLGSGNCLRECGRGRAARLKRRLTAWLNATTASPVAADLAQDLRQCRDVRRARGRARDRAPRSRRRLLLPALRAGCSRPIRWRGRWADHDPASAPDRATKDPFLIKGRAIEASSTKSRRKPRCSNGASKLLRA